MGHPRVQYSEKSEPSFLHSWIAQCMVPVCRFCTPKVYSEGRFAPRNPGAVCFKFVMCNYLKVNLRSAVHIFPGQVTTFSVFLHWQTWWAIFGCSNEIFPTERLGKLFEAELSEADEVVPAFRGNPYNRTNEYRFEASMGDWGGGFCCRCSCCMLIGWESSVDVGK